MKIIITEEQYKNIFEQDSVIKVANDYNLSDTINKFCVSNNQATKEIVDKSYQEYLPKLNEYITEFLNRVIEKYDDDQYFKWFSSDIKNMDKAIRNYLIQESTKLYYAYFGYGKGVDLQSIFINLFNYLYKIMLKKLESPLIKTTAGMMITKKNLPDVLRATDHVLSSNVALIKMLIMQTIKNEPIIHANTSRIITSQLPRCNKILVTMDSYGNKLPPNKQYHPYMTFKQYQYITRDMTPSGKELVQPQIDNLKKMLSTLA